MCVSIVVILLYIPCLEKRGRATPCKTLFDACLLFLPLFFLVFGSPLRIAPVLFLCLGVPTSMLLDGAERCMHWIATLVVFVADFHPDYAFPLAVFYQAILFTVTFRIMRGKWADVVALSATYLLIIQAYTNSTGFERIYAVYASTYVYVGVAMFSTIAR
jgi:hypothetical protein